MQTSPSRCCVCVCVCVCVKENRDRERKTHMPVSLQVFQLVVLGGTPAKHVAIITPYNGQVPPLLLLCPPLSYYFPSLPSTSSAVSFSLVALSSRFLPKERHTHTHSLLLSLPLPFSPLLILMYFFAGKALVRYGPAAEPRQGDRVLNRRISGARERYYPLLSAHTHTHTRAHAHTHTHTHFSLSLCRCLSAQC